VADLPGLTRDRHYGEGRVGERPFLVIDTGGFEPVAKDGIMYEMAKQTKQAVAEADVVVFIVDGRQGLTPHDKTITDFLRKSGRPVMLVVNKAEGMKYTSVVADFYELGMGDPYVISAAHGDGVADLVQEALDLASPARPEPEPKSRRARHQDRHRRPSQRRQVDAGQHPAGRRARDRLRHAGHHARLDRDSVRARWRITP
jgi:GTP-binding protein